MDNNLALLGAGALVIVCIAALGFLPFIEGSARALKRRASIDPVRAGRASLFDRALAALTRQQTMTVVQRLEVIEAEGVGLKRETMRQKLVRAGLDMSSTQFLILSTLCGFGAAFAVYILVGDIMLAVATAAIVGFLLPPLIVGRLIKKRLAKFLRGFPNAIDVIVRGVRSGLPVSECIRITAAEAPDPVGPEMARIVAATQVGVSLDDALEQFGQRVSSPDVVFFRNVLSIQKQTGGNLAESLENLSDILRERTKMLLKIKALSSEARMSALIIGALPFVVATLVYILRPDYILVLFEETLGQILLGGAAVWMAIGALAMRAMVNFEI